MSADADQNRRGRPGHSRAAAGAASKILQLVSRLSAIEPDLGVVAAYGRISCPDVLLAVPRLGMINVHGSILPCVPRRGAGPSRGDRRRHGDGRHDHARHQRARCRSDVRDATHARSVPTKRARRSSEALADARCGAAARGRRSDRGRYAPSETPQDDSRATFAPKLTKDGGANRLEPARARPSTTSSGACSHGRSRPRVSARRAC